MRKVIKKIITEKEIQDFTSVAITGPMLEKLLSYSRDGALSSDTITKCVAALMKLSEDGATIDLVHYNDVLALMK